MIRIMYYDTWYDFMIHVSWHVLCIMIHNTILWYMYHDTYHDNDTYHDIIWWYDRWYDKRDYNTWWYDKPKKLLFCLLMMSLSWSPACCLTGPVILWVKRRRAKARTSHKKYAANPSLANPILINWSISVEGGGVLRSVLLLHPEPELVPGVVRLAGGVWGDGGGVGLRGWRLVQQRGQGGQDRGGGRWGNSYYLSCLEMSSDHHSGPGVGARSWQGGLLQSAELLQYQLEAAWGWPVWGEDDVGGRVSQSWGRGGTLCQAKTQLGLPGLSAQWEQDLHRHQKVSTVWWREVVRLQDQL